MNEAPRVRRSQEERTALSDRLLMRAAVDLLVTRGIAGTTLNAIAEGSGYSRGLVTHRFGSKAGLFAYVHDTVSMRCIAQIKGSVGEATGIDALRRVVDALLGFIVESPGEVRAMYQLRYASIDPGAEFRANVAKMHRAQRRDVERWIRDGQREGGIAAGIDAALAAEMFCSVADGLLYRWLVNPHIEIAELHRLLKDKLPMLAIRPAAATPSSAGHAARKKPTLKSARS